MNDGAVPLGFSTGMAPSGMSAWRSLLGVMIMPRRRNRWSICSSRPASRNSLRPHTSAMTSRVRSSWVGPSPPLVMTRSARSRARPMTSFMRPGLSPTMVLKKRLIPRSERRWAIHAELVSTICPSSKLRSYGDDFSVGHDALLSLVGCVTATRGFFGPQSLSICVRSAPALPPVGNCFLDDHRMATAQCRTLSKRIIDRLSIDDKDTAFCRKTRASVRGAGEA